MIRTLIAAAVATALVSSTVDAATHQHGTRHRAAQSIHKNGLPVHAAITPAGLTVLYDQFAHATNNGFYTDEYGSSSSSFDSEGADDFVVPAGGWTVSQFNFQGFAFNYSSSSSLSDWPATTNVTVYPDVAGAPGPTSVCSYPAAADTYDAQNAIVSVSLATPCVLAPGTYWVAMAAVNEIATTGEDFFWIGSTPVANSGAVWRDPNGGFNTNVDCTAFTPITSCITTIDPDFAFQVVGHATTPVRLQDFSVD